MGGEGPAAYHPSEVFGWGGEGPAAYHPSEVFGRGGGEGLAAYHPSEVFGREPRDWPRLRRPSFVSD